jgi:hypothetical protein
MPQHRNPIRIIGDRQPRRDIVRVTDELVREGGHAKSLGSDGVLVLEYLLSRGSGWETSARQICQQFGWGRNRDRATAALQRLVKDHRLVIRDYEGGRYQYVLCAYGRRFTAEELERETEGGTETVRGDGW